MCRALRNRYCQEGKPHLDEGASESDRVSPAHLSGAERPPERLLTLLGEFDLDIFEIDRAACLQTLGFESCTRRINSGFTDLVLSTRGPLLDG
jgi:hypothetical protein